jgi:hypothetical protein
MTQISKKLRDKSLEFEREVKEKTFGYIVASFGLVAGLAWNEAIKAMIESFFPLQGDTLKAKFVYAIAITVVVVFVSLYFSKFFKKAKTEEVKENKKIAKD